MIALALSIILAALAIIVICVLDIRTYWADKSITLILSCSVLILGMCAVIVICALGMREKIIHHEDRFPAKEYRIETEIITRGDISDTTYIITKKIIIMENINLKIGDALVDKSDNDITGVVKAKINDLVAIQWNDNLIDWLLEKEALKDFELKEDKPKVELNHKFNYGDKVLAKMDDGYEWQFGRFAHYSGDSNYPYCVSGTFMRICKRCIPYNKDTFELIGTKKIL